MMIYIEYNSTGGVSRRGENAVAAIHGNAVYLIQYVGKTVCKMG